MIFDVFPNLNASMMLGGPFICRTCYHKLPPHPKKKKQTTTNTNPRYG